MLTDHEILGIPPGASAAEIRTAFREKANQCHPDTAGGKADEAAFLLLVEAYDRITNGEERGADAESDTPTLRRGPIQGSWNPPPVKPTARSHRPAVKRRPRVNDGELPDESDRYDVEFYLGPFQVHALKTGDLAIESRVFERGQETTETFVVPQGTPHGTVLQYTGVKWDRSSSANWFDALVRYH